MICTQATPVGTCVMVARALPTAPSYVEQPASRATRVRLETVTRFIRIPPFFGLRDWDPTTGSRTDGRCVIWITANLRRARECFEEEWGRGMEEERFFYRPKRAAPLSSSSIRRSRLYL